MSKFCPSKPKQPVPWKNTEQAEPKRLKQADKKMKQRKSSFFTLFVVIKPKKRVTRSLEVSNITDNFKTYW